MTYRIKLTGEHGTVEIRDETESDWTYQYYIVEQERTKESAIDLYKTLASAQSKEKTNDTRL